MECAYAFAYLNSYAPIVTTESVPEIKIVKADMNDQEVSDARRPSSL